MPHVGWNALQAPRGPDQSSRPARRRSAEALAEAGGSALLDEGSSLLETGSAPHAFTARILSGLPSGAHVYFTHSYAAPVTPDCVAATTHAETFSAVVERGNVFGVQFHPEKSSDAGLRIIRNFLEVTRGC